MRTALYRTILYICVSTFFLSACAATATPPASGNPLYDAADAPSQPATPPASGGPLYYAADAPSYARFQQIAWPEQASARMVQDRIWQLLHAGSWIDCLDITASAARRAGLTCHWYPQVLSTVLIAVDRDRTAQTIESWLDLSQLETSLWLLEQPDRLPLIWSSIAWGLTGTAQAIDDVVDLLQPLHRQGRLKRNNRDAAVLICFDDQAVSMIAEGRNLELIIPREGTLSFRRGLLSRNPIDFPETADDALIEAGFRLPDGSCDAAGFPDEAEYLRATVLEDTVWLGDFARVATTHFQRRILGVGAYKAAEKRENTVIIVFTIIILMVWCASMIRRSSQSSMRRATLLTGVSLIFWIAIRHLKWSVISEPVVTVYLWYGFYFALLSLPLYLLWMTAAIDRETDDGRPPPVWWAACSVNMLLLLLTLSNNLHQWVFQFASDRIDSYRYGWGYHLIFLVIAVEVFGAFVLLFRKCLHSARKSAAVLPAIVLTLALFYCLAYALRLGFTVQSDFTLFFCLFTLLFYEATLRTGFIPVNRMYDALFAGSPLNMRLVDSAGRTALASPGVEPLTPALWQDLLRRAPQPVRQGDRHLLFASPLPGGMVVWQKDIRVLDDLNRQIAESVAKLRAANTVLRGEAELHGSLAASRARDALLSGLETRIDARLEDLYRRIRDLPQAADEHQAIAAAALLACFIKRRGNLYFMAQSDSRMTARDLTLYLDELADLAGFAGVRCRIGSRLERPLSVSDATLIYAFVYALLEWGVPTRVEPLLMTLTASGSEILLSAMLPPSGLDFPISCEMAEDHRLQGVTLHRQELEQAVSLRLTLPLRETSDG